METFGYMESFGYKNQLSERKSHPATDFLYSYRAIKF